MLKHIAIALLISLVAIFTVHENVLIISWLVHTHYVLATLLAKILAGGTTAALIRKTLALFIIPFVIALIPTAVYWGMTRREFNYFPHVFWVTWLLLFTALAIH